MTGRMSHLVIEAVIVVLPAAKGRERRHSNHVVTRRVNGGESGVVDGTELCFLNDSGSPFIRWRIVLAGSERGRLYTLGLVEIENIRPADEGNALRCSIVLANSIPIGVRLVDKRV